MKDPGEVIIRKAKLYDVPSIVRIEAETSSTPWSADSITRDVSSNERAYVAVCSFPADEGEVPEIAGYADMWIIAGEAQLNNIAVDEEYRGNHFGEMLLGHLITKAEESGCVSMNLEVRVSNSAAISLYEKMGFGRITIRKRYYRDNHEDALIMERSLKI